MRGSDWLGPWGPRRVADTGSGPAHRDHGLPPRELSAAATDLANDLREAETSGKERRERETGLNITHPRLRPAAVTGPAQKTA